MSHDIKQLIPKHPDGHARILAIGRLSKPKGTEEETQETIESSLAVAREHIKNIYKGPMILTQLAEQESGLIADRTTIMEAEELIATGEIDLVIAEDLSRIYRSPRHQHVFVDDCVDTDVRVICVADRLDTSEEDSESAMGFASLRHSLPISDCRRRQKRKSKFGFHGGGSVHKISYGYVRLTRDQAASGQFGPVRLRVAKMSEATRIIKKMREMLMATRNGQYSYVPIVDYLIENNIPVGPYVTNGKWNQRLVKDLLTDPILIGVRRFRTMLFKRVRSTGKFRRELNPDGPETEHYPELAHLTDDEFVTMQAVIEEIAEQHKKKAGSDHPLYRKPRRDAIFPRQHATCSACNGLMYAYDSGQIKCENAHARGADHCWNHVQVDIEQAHQKVIPWLIAQFEGVPGFRGRLVDCALEELASLRAKLHQGRPSRRLTINQLEREATNIAKAIRVGGDLEALFQEAQDIEEQLGKLRVLEQNSVVDESGLPACCSPEEVDQQLDDVLLHLAVTSCDFAYLMREILPQSEIVPVQAIDTGQVRPRVRITLSLDQIRGDADEAEAIPKIQVELDLFDAPKRFRHIGACLEVKRDNPRLSYIKIADAVNERLAQQRKEGHDSETISYMTVKRCFAVARHMEAEGLTEPYRVLTEEPKYASRWKPRNKKTDDAT